MDELHSRLANLPNEAIREVSAYLQQSFGDRERIDYGSGHELNFMCWLYLLPLLAILTPRRLCLRELDILNSEDYKSLVLVVFNQYLRLIRIH